eukprot:Protomagalhaensia_sp_Gyna_25__1122@NODE_154_length_4779_cov_328_335443_g120_i0_p2_GENE_NODE_154_length_4779_cov_328_335443_g120_i0NODE_154_length_4779_cov_328_335443_g120_i0_p2_ORF_typecomplete_len447_score60_54Acyltransferase/PF01553_21/1_9e03Acyltransferase/PF01553_21/9e18DAGAT/PF03982_13/2_4e03DAGAT/PF03982_13/0_14Lip_A_acyltrans/PF03279_13/0_4_NODE_154_length_4779_cov_328_335443_g120_i034384715
MTRSACTSSGEDRPAINSADEASDGQSSPAEPKAVMSTADARGQLRDASSATLPETPTAPPTTGADHKPIAPRPAPQSSTPLYIRVLISAYFYILTFITAAITTFALITIHAVRGAVDIAMKYIEETEEAKTVRECRREYLEGLMIDLCVKSIMLFTNWIFRVHMVGPGTPLDKLTIKELNNHIAENKTVKVLPGGQTVEVCRLPRRVQDNRVRLPGSCIVMCNHLSNIDGFTVKAGLFPSVSKAIIKAEVKWVPFIGTTIYLSGQPLVHFTSERGGWGTAHKDDLLTACKRVLNRNFPLIVYPEGVRRRFGRMAPFRYGMFNLAIENGYPILPCVIHGSQHAWPVDSMLVDFADIYLKFGDELVLPRKNDTPDMLIEVVRGKMLEMLEDIPGYDPVAEAPFMDYAEYKQYEKAELEVAESKKKK